MDNASKTLWKRGPDQQERSRERRAVFIRAARKLILERGTAAVTMGFVAELVGSSDASIYRYFANRIELLNAVLDDDYRRLAHTFDYLCATRAPMTDTDILNIAREALVTRGDGEVRPAPFSISLERGSDPGALDYPMEFANRVARTILSTTDSAVSRNDTRRYALAFACVAAVLNQTPAPRNAAQRRRRSQTSDAVFAAVLQQPIGGPQRRFNRTPTEIAIKPTK
jgi:AcrR family transcriptional regulator